MDVTVSSSGKALSWGQDDVHVETAGVLAAMLVPSMCRAFASVGGRATSKRKAAAARANDRNGRAPAQERPRHEARHGPSFGVLQVAENLPLTLRRRDAPEEERG